MSCCNSCASGVSGKMYTADSRFGGMERGVGDAPTVSNVAMTAAVTGLIGAAEGYLVYGTGTAMLVPGLGTVSAPTGFGIHTALASVLGQYADYYADPTGQNPLIPSGFQEPVFTGVAEIATQYLAGNSGIPMLSSFLIGSTSSYLQPLIYKPS